MAEAKSLAPGAAPKAGAEAEPHASAAYMSKRCAVSAMDVAGSNDTTGREAREGMRRTPPAAPKL